MLLKMQVTKLKKLLKNKIKKHQSIGVFLFRNGRITQKNKHKFNEYYYHSSIALSSVFGSHVMCILILFKSFSSFLESI